MKYVFFVEDKRVARTTFKKLMDLSRIYSKKVDGKDLKARRKIASELMSRLKYA